MFHRIFEPPVMPLPRNIARTISTLRIDVFYSWWSESRSALESQDEIDCSGVNTVVLREIYCFQLRQGWIPKDIRKDPFDTVRHRVASCIRDQPA
jgi:hypothetical protein